MLISFIISQRKSIPAIKSSVEKLSKVYGKKIDMKVPDFIKNINPDTEFYSFPTPEVLANASIDEIIDYSLRNRNGNKRRIFQNFLDAKKGDIVFGYEFAPTQKIVAILKVSTEQDDENIYFKKL